jgi:hypothetical protein
LHVGRADRNVRGPRSAVRGVDEELEPREWRARMPDGPRCTAVDEHGNE